MPPLKGLNSIFLVARTPPACGGLRPGLILSPSRERDSSVEGMKSIANQIAWNYVNKARWLLLKSTVRSVSSVVKKNSLCLRASVVNYFKRRSSVTFGFSSPRRLA
jgi:hypothetical protein